MTTTDGDAMLDAVGAAFSRLRRGALLRVENPVPRKDMTRTLVLNLIEEGPESQRREVTVGVVAERLGVDPSVASRMVSDCIASGYLVRAASQRDGRRTVLELTAAGRAMLDRFRAHQRQAFEFITRDWSRGERMEFARLLLKYVDALAELRPDDADPGDDARPAGAGPGVAGRQSGMPAAAKLE
ncbi:DNA-binding MarR family transcriptional regulator [Actinoplanes octamycinicus]|uniref:DNA-binding MarR family transcriptional regulator n=1 Tax=Actinoplanes octamycinicus TaxID=135948 RepID=A0A7W7H3L5_9ACTN|nr:MarR family winged helix-turn-helix transcriptional regulator [Actinoplanes octamycinicus]MBB4743349.1 DNA-binding MarR family transcriptional regulator [Actinoplanes octamycinicus]